MIYYYNIETSYYLLFNYFELMLVKILFPFCKFDSNDKTLQWENGSLLCYFGILLIC